MSPTTRKAIDLILSDKTTTNTDLHGLAEFFGRLTKDKFNTLAKLDALCTLHPVSDERRNALRIALELGCWDGKVITAIMSARHTARGKTITLPPNRFELKSRGKGWARKGKGTSAVWAERVEGGYMCGPGKWSIGGHDGFSRKDSTEYFVSHIQVGSETWTVAI